MNLTGSPVETWATKKAILEQFKQDNQTHTPERKKLQEPSSTLIEHCNKQSLSTTQKYRKQNWTRELNTTSGIIIAMKACQGVGIKTSKDTYYKYPEEDRQTKLTWSLRKKKIRKTALSEQSRFDKRQTTNISSS